MNVSVDKSLKWDERSRSDLIGDSFQLTFFVLLFAASVCLNAVVFYSVMKKQLLTISGNLFVFSLTMSNCLDAFLTIPFLLMAGILDDWALGQPACNLLAFTHFSVSLNNNLTFVLIALDRYYAIVKPMKYHEEITARRAIQLVLSCWLLSLMSATPPLWGWSSYAYQPCIFTCGVAWNEHPIFSISLLVTMVLAPLVIMTICYICVYKAAILQHRISMCSSESALSTFADANFKLRKKLPWVVITYSNVSRARKTLTLIFGSFLATWAFAIWNILYDLSGHVDAGPAPPLLYFIHRISGVSIPLIYGFMNGLIRRRIRRMLRVSKQRTRLNEDSASTASFFDSVPNKFDTYYGVDSSEIMKILQKSRGFSFKRLKGDTKTPGRRSTKIGRKRFKKSRIVSESNCDVGCRRAASPSCDEMSNSIDFFDSTLDSDLDIFECESNKRDLTFRNFFTNPHAVESSLIMEVDNGSDMYNWRPIENI